MSTVRTEDANKSEKGMKRKDQGKVCSTRNLIQPRKDKKYMSIKEQKKAAIKKVWGDIQAKKKADEKAKTLVKKVQSRKAAAKKTAEEAAKARRAKAK